MKERSWRLLFVIALVIGTILPAQAAVELQGEFKHQVLVRENLILTTAKTGGEIGLWDLDRSRNGKLNRPASTLETGLSSIETLQVSPNGQLFAVTGVRDDRQDGKVAVIRVYSSSSGKLEHSFNADKASDPAALVAFDRLGTLAFYVGGDLGKLDLRTGRQVLYRRDRNATVDNLSISPDGETVAVLSGGKSTSYSSRDEDRDGRRNRD